MRVGIVTPGISADARDWCIPALLDLVRALSATDEVTVFTLRYPHTRAEYRLGDVRVQPFGAAESRGPGRLLMWLRAYLAIRRAAPGLDIIHALWAHEPALLALAGARASKAPVLASLMGGELVDLPEIGYGGLRDRGNRLFVRRTLKRAHRLSAGSERLAEAVRARSERDCDVLPLGVDPLRFTREGGLRPLTGDPALLTVGSLVPVKDHVMLFQAFARLRVRRPEARLHIVGEGPLRPRLATLAAQLGIAEDVHYHGAVPHDALGDYYRAASAVVISSRFESQSMVALEAAACGRAVVGTEVGVVPELRGPVVPPAADQALAALLASFTHQDAFDQLGDRQRRMVLDRFTVEHCVARLRAVYDRLANP